MRQIQLYRKIVSVVVAGLKIDRNALDGENPKTSSAERGTIIVDDFYELQSPENFSFSVFLSPRINQNSFCLLNEACGRADVSTSISVTIWIDPGSMTPTLRSK